MLTATTAAVVLAAASAAFAPAPAQAASSVRISKIYYNSPGTDTRTNASLNAEYVVVTNYSSVTRSITGWTVRDYTGHTYKFPTTSIGAGKTVVLHTGKGTNSGAHRYWQQANYIWNNDKDTAYVRNSGGTLVQTCSYNSTSYAYKNC